MPRIPAAGAPAGTSLPAVTAGETAAVGAAERGAASSSGIELQPRRPSKRAAPPVGAQAPRRPDARTRPPTKKFSVKKTLAVDLEALFAEVKAARAFNYTPLLDDATGEEADAAARFKSLFEHAVTQFRDDAQGDAIDALREDGVVHRYAMDKPELFAPFNDFFGMLKALDPERRKKGLASLLAMQDADLNCAAGMRERLEIDKMALTDGNGFVSHLYADAERTVVMGAHRVVNVHVAHAEKTRLLHAPTQAQKELVQAIIGKNMEAFLEADVQKFIDELVAIVARGQAIGATVDAIKACQEKHLPTLRWFFPPRVTETAAQGSASSSSAMLCNHQDYLEMDDDCFSYTRVNDERIMRDALQVMLPVLSQTSKIQILHKNPALWSLLYGACLPELAAARPDLTNAEFFDKTLFQTLIPEMIENGVPISRLVSEQIVALDKLFLSSGEQPAPIDQLIAKNAVPADVEMVCLQCLRQGQPTLAYRLAAAPGIPDMMVSICQLDEIKIAPQDDVARKLEKSVTALRSISNPEVRSLLWERLGVAFCAAYPGLDGAGQLDAVAYLHGFLDSTDFPAKERVALLKILCASLQPAGESAQRLKHTVIISLIDRQTRGMDRSLLGKQAVDILIDLIGAMGNLHAATLRRAPAGMLKGELARTQDPQLHAYKLIKRRLDETLKQPATALKLIEALWSGDTLERLSSATRTLSAAHLKKVLTSLFMNGLLYGATHGAASAMNGVLDGLQVHADAVAQLDVAVSDLNETLHPLFAACDQAQQILDEMSAYPILADIVNQDILLTGAETGQPYLPGLSNIGSLPSAAGVLQTHLASLDPTLLSPSELDVLDRFNDSLAAVQAEDAKLAGVALFDKFDLARQAVRENPDLPTLGTEAIDVFALPELLEFAGPAVEASYLLGLKVPDRLMADLSRLRDELRTWGPVGALRTARALVNVIRNEPLAGIQQAVMRLTPHVLSHLRRKTLPVQPERHAAHMEKLNATWCAVLERLDMPDAAADGPPAPALPQTRRLEVLGEYIKEMDVANFPGVDADAIAAARETGLGRISTAELHALLPKLYGRSKVAYLELAEYLVRRAPGRSDASAQQIDEIARKMGTITGMTGKLTRLGYKGALMQWRNRLKPAWLRLDFGIVGGWTGRGIRTNAINEMRRKNLAAVRRKQERITGAVVRFSAQDVALPVADGAGDPAKVRDLAARIRAARDKQRT